ncbi:MAG: fibrobacter succinogenes major paralogous domain-containing protein, partial [Bacteroidales bacterium]|jgi:uncharacterized protein (TIGR02145 family)|nr:fibrobacter succinogenes major paralogous domain-containing protein [Bacteroidales bacterium]
LFSWCAVARFGATLCPHPWRVPTVRDFIALDRALGGTGENRADANVRNRLLNDWAGAYGGYCTSGGSLDDQGSWAYYWSSSEQSAVNGFYLPFGTTGNVYPQSSGNKSYGFTLRCVR